MILLMVTTWGAVILRYIFVDMFSLCLCRHTQWIKWSRYECVWFALIYQLAAYEDWTLPSSSWCWNRFPAPMNIIWEKEAMFTCAIIFPIHPVYIHLAIHQFSINLCIILHNCGGCCIKMILVEHSTFTIFMDSQWGNQNGPLCCLTATLLPVMKLQV